MALLVPFKYNDKPSILMTNVKATVSVIARCWNEKTPSHPSKCSRVHLEIWCVRKGGQNICERLNNGEHCLTVGQCVRATFNRPTKGKRFENDSVFKLDIEVSESYKCRTTMHYIPHKGVFHRRRAHKEARARCHKIGYEIKCDTMHECKDGWRPWVANDYPPGFRSALRCLAVLAKGHSPLL